MKMNGLFKMVINFSINPRPLTLISINNWVSSPSNRVYKSPFALE
ncbi:hypothetical protein CLV98_102213 [Dyadobacter jejuensis]|uniref:Uncharacterized protein n=1 Tax=Dyadobacter jejuensis TaxID=1082580 RepID=A0A316ARC6_9BACT|nr:hypothetical protein CLV98_102213 [Dyadobacter jejuensis]